MLEDKLRATDWEATNEVMEEQVARESYLQWFKDNERRKRNMVNLVHFSFVLPFLPVFFHFLSDLVDVCRLM